MSTDNENTDSTTHSRAKAKYYVSRTLFGGLDANKRVISRKTDHVPVATFNDAMGLWTSQMERELNACLWALNDMAERASGENDVEKGKNDLSHQFT